MKSALCFLAVLGVATAHMCLINPKQRGTIGDLDQKGSNDCLLLSGPCGGRESEPPTSMWQPGQEFEVIFQKNLDHYDERSPGYFSISLLEDEREPRELTRVPDRGEPSLHIYNAKGYLPADVSKGVHTLQVQYVTRNSQAPPAFFQCSDVMVMELDPGFHY